MDKPIVTSIFDIFKIGPGPSSSHTIGPMKGAHNFIETASKLPLRKIDEACKIKVHLYNSLSATGRGHGTDNAVIAGLLGFSPDQCPRGLLPKISKDKEFHSNLSSKKIKITHKDIIFEKRKHPGHPNTFKIKLLGSKNNILFERSYRSIGGGMIEWTGMPKQSAAKPPNEYSNSSELCALTSSRTPLHAIIIANECALAGKSIHEIDTNLDAIIVAMKQSVEHGLIGRGVLPGNIGLHRKAASLYRQASQMKNTPAHFILSLSAYAFAVAEENAAGEIIVTAPTCGSAGVIPATVYAAEKHLGLRQSAIRRGMLAASAIAMIAKSNASISGAEVGCQGEIGVASAMAAGLLIYAVGGNCQLTFNAAETALEHHLGLTCDPVGGYVQIPCIERNAMGAVKAYLSYLIASEENKKFHKVNFDTVISSMAATGRDLPPKYRETARGGLAKYMKCSCG